jgi:hypothetical protein
MFWIETASASSSDIKESTLLYESVKMTAQTFTIFDPVNYKYKVQSLPNLNMMINADIAVEFERVIEKENWNVENRIVALGSYGDVISYHQGAIDLVSDSG